MNYQHVSELWARLLTLVATNYQVVSMTMVAFSFAAVWMISSHRSLIRRWGMVVGFTGQVVWLSFGAGLHIPALVLHAVVLGGAYTRGWLKWGPHGSIARNDREILASAAAQLLLEHHRMVNLGRRNDREFLRERFGADAALPASGWFHVVDVGPVRAPQWTLIPPGEAQVWVRALAAVKGSPAVHDLSGGTSVVLGQPIRPAFVAAGVAPVPAGVSIGQVT
jgi:hypothetical protein